VRLLEVTLTALPQTTQTGRFGDSFP